MQLPTINPRRIHQIAEFISGALYRVDFEHLGDTDEGATTWFTRGMTPKKVRVRIERSEIYPAVFVTTEYYNLALKKKGEVRIQVDVANEYSDAQIQEAAEEAVVRVLELFKDVLEGKGVAGPQAGASLN